MMNYMQGNAAKLPHEVLVHMVAARYGQDPEVVKDWATDTFMDAVNFLPITGGRGGR